MVKERIVLVAIIIALIILNLFTVYRYETQLLERRYEVIGGVKIKQYTAQEVITLIKRLPDYQGDSLYIQEDGILVSLVPEINAGINSFYQSEGLEYIKGVALSEKVPLQFAIYRHVIPYVIKEHGDRRVNKAD